MDLLFHGVSSAFLARVLGESRKPWLIAAAAVGVSPDATWIVTRVVPEWRDLYAFQHSLLINVPLCLLFCAVNWRIAFGGLLHVLFDVFTHNSSTKYLFYPFFDIRLPIGTAWWAWPGITVWVALWLCLLLCMFRFFRRLKPESMPEPEL
jgi:hypothetical protein